MPSAVKARPFSPPSSIHCWTAIWALASSWRSRFSGIGAVVVFQRALDIDRVGIVPLDQVAVVAVHRPHEIGQRREHAVRQAAPEPRPTGPPARPPGPSGLAVGGALRGTSGSIAPRLHPGPRPPKCPLLIRIACHRKRIIPINWTEQKAAIWSCGVRLRSFGSEWQLTGRFQKPSSPSGTGHPRPATYPISPAASPQSGSIPENNSKEIVNRPFGGQDQFPALFREPDMLGMHCREPIARDDRHRTHGERLLRDLHGRPPNCLNEQARSERGCTRPGPQHKAFSRENQNGPPRRVLEPSQRRRDQRHAIPFRAQHPASRGRPHPAQAPAPGNRRAA